MLEEADKMVKDSESRLKNAVEDLRELIVSPPEIPVPLYSFTRQ
jgi:hypothetical protein